MPTFVSSAACFNSLSVAPSRSSFVPHLTFNGKYLLTLVAILGTTISPYLFFWQASEEVGRDGRPQYCDEREQVLAVERQVRDEGRAQDLAPVGPGEEGRADVREQREREPLEDVRD